MYWTEALVGGYAVLSVIIIFALIQPDQDAPEPAPVSQSPVTIDIKPVDETPDNLDNSKYQ